MWSTKLWQTFLCNVQNVNQLLRSVHLMLAPIDSIMFAVCCEAHRQPKWDTNKNKIERKIPENVVIRDARPQLDDVLNDTGLDSWGNTSSRSEETGKNTTHASSCVGGVCPETRYFLDIFPPFSYLRCIHYTVMVQGSGKLSTHGVWRLTVSHNFLILILNFGESNVMRSNSDGIESISEQKQNAMLQLQWLMSGISHAWMA